jgi:PTS system sucrose-specific IIC component
VKLNGKGFEINVQAGDQVHQGDVIGKVDWSVIREAQLAPVTLTIITNSGDYQVDKKIGQTDVQATSILMENQR